MRHFIAILILMAAGIFLSAPAHTQTPTKRPFTFDDMMALKRISGPQVSPDGKWVLFSAVDVNLQEKISREIPDSWRPPRRMGQRVVISLEFRAAGRRRLRSSDD